MALNIKDRETETLARNVARKSGKSITDAVKAALQKEMARLSEDQETMVRNLLAIGERMSRYPTVDDRSIDEMLYDENGLPK